MHETLKRERKKTNMPEQQQMNNIKKKHFRPRASETNGDDNEL